jgi:hypothetical protein
VKTFSLSETDPRTARKFQCRIITSIDPEGQLAPAQCSADQRESEEGDTILTNPKSKNKRSFGE